jgi:hypothetical protein
MAGLIEMLTSVSAPLTATTVDGGDNTQTAAAEKKLQEIFNTTFGARLPSIPSSWSAELRAKAFQAALDEQGDKVNTDHLKVEADDGSMSIDEELLKAAVKDGKFDMKGAIGRKWEKALKDNDALKEEYKALGRSYDAQRKFRTKWAQGEYEVLHQQRLRETQSTIADTREGVYQPFTIILQQEGGDEAAMVATANYVNEAMSRHSRGESCKGRPWLMVNSFTKRLEFLYIKRGLAQTHSDTWLERTVEQKRSSPSDSNASDPSGGGASNKAASNQSSSLPSPSPPKDGVKKPPTKKPKLEGSQGTPLPDDSGLTKKMLRARAAKGAMLSEASSANDVLSMASAQPEWSWANHAVILQPLRDALQAVEKFKKSSTFWKDWVVQESKQWIPYCKKNYLEAVIKSELGKLDELESLTANLRRETLCLKTMHEARKHLAK